MLVMDRTWSLARRKAAICVALGVITLAVFSPCLKHDFLAYDDQQYVTENPHAQAGLTRPGVVWAFTTYYASNWHPLTWLSHMLDCQLYGLNPAGHHLTNVLLHTGSVILLFLVVSRMTGSLWRSAMVAALFAWHPLHVESVAWIAERKDVLSTCFFMLTLLFYSAYATRVEGPAKSNAEIRIPKSEGRPKSEIRSPQFGAEKRAGLEAARFGDRAAGRPCYPFYALSLFFFACGLMSKPMLVTLPFVLLLLDYWPLERFQLQFENQPRRLSGQESTPNAFGAGIKNLLLEKLPFVAFSTACCVLTVSAQRQAFTIVSVRALPLSRRIAHALVAYAHYLGAAFVPRHLAVCYPYEAATPEQAIGAGFVIAIISFFTLRLASRRPYFLVGWLWYLGMLVPVIGLVQVGDQAWADRYTYLPLVGLFISFVWGLGDFASHFTLHAPRSPEPNEAHICSGSRQKQKSDLGRLTLPALAGVAALGLLTGTTLQLRYWKNTRTLFEHSAQVTRNNGRALDVLGSLLAGEGKLPEAMDLYAQALRIRSDDPEAHFLMGNALETQGKLDAAVGEYTQALWFKPLEEKTRIFLGVALAKQKHDDEAAAQYRAALALDPESALAHNNLARLLHTQGRPDEAIEHYSAALRSDPRLAEARNNLGVLLLQKGRVVEGVEQLREAVRLQPGDFKSECNLAAALNQQEKWHEAADIFSRLSDRRPDDANLHYQYGLALAHLQKTRDAMSHYAEALLRQPNFPEALNGLAWILATDLHPEIRNGTEAVRMAEGACDLTGHRQAPLVLTLAAAYAETGKFPEAVAAAQKALELAATAVMPSVAGKCRSLLEAFKSGKPWRETPS